ncbi:hypothetical protein B0T16DRAFT_492196 [Cercophora newfieldiana]|uniref:Uncharacterized protein n=1 Tax=Cercophora newfieldiana TaxID=92897 RepID=A0AA39YBI8_9PEZI|nr:hypothetical protein B0T16DRAFT_492196 [Cercophora newfieldiana]
MVIHHYPPPPPTPPTTFTRPFPRDFPTPPFPTCTCCTFYQLYACGCPDAGRDPATGTPIPSIYRCPHTFAPIPEQIWNRGCGFQHKNPFPHSDVVRVLPFACFAHAGVARRWVSPEALREKRRKVIEGRWMDQAVVADVNLRLLGRGTQGKRKRGEEAAGVRTVPLPGRGAIWGVKRRRTVRTEVEAQAEAARVEAKRTRYWVDRYEASRGDPAAAWRSEEREVDVDLLEERKGEFLWGTHVVRPKTRFRLSPRFAPDKEDIYENGAWEVDEEVLRNVWDLNWGIQGAAELLGRATTVNTLLTM